MDAMEQAAELQKLREEINALSAQVAVQQQFLLLAKQRLQNLSPATGTATHSASPALPLKAPSLETLSGFGLYTW